MNRRTLLFIGAVTSGAFVVALVIFMLAGRDEELKLSPQVQQSAGETIENPRTEFNAPVPPILPDFEQEIALSDLLTETITNALNDLKNQNYPAQTITYLPIRLEQLTTQGEPQYLSSQIFLSSLGINVPNGFFEAVSPVLMLYVYGSGGEEKSRCEEANIQDKTCYGPRVGLVFKAKDGQASALNSLAAQWRTMQDTNLDKLILSDAKQIPSSLSFTSAQFRGLSGTKTPITIYYSNLPISTTTLNFAVVNDFMVVASSKNSSFFMVDRILNQ